MKVINLFGGPGCGKSTTAAALFAKMKYEGLKVELVTEFAKDLTYEARGRTLENQLYLLGKQDNRLRRLQGHVDWAITDSPLILSLAYVKPPFDAEWFTRAVVGVFKSYDNYNVTVERVKPYAEFGRNQSELEARGLDQVIENLAHLHLRDQPWLWVPGDVGAAEVIYWNFVGGRGG